MGYFPVRTEVKELVEKFKRDKDELIESTKKNIVENTDLTSDDLEIEEDGSHIKIVAKNTNRKEH
ncbi:MAG: hypothetical protein OXH16_19555 [Gemmatimonadetes bacterium]|nr:hypothetical protein [Gemmatimonadota bacterium]